MPQSEGMADYRHLDRSSACSHVSWIEPRQYLSLLPYFMYCVMLKHMPPLRSSYLVEFVGSVPKLKVCFDNYSGLLLNLIASIYIYIYICFIFSGVHESHRLAALEVVLCIVHDVHS